VSFAHAWVLHVLWVLPVAAGALLAHHRRRARALARFAEPALLARLTGAALPGVGVLKSALLLTALGLSIVALAGPRWGSHFQEVTQKGVDIVLLADVSPSMLVEDVKPNRLERARREIQDFLRVVQGDRVGLVAFSGAAFVQCPLTLDYAALEMFLQALTPELIPTAGTDLGAAIETGLTAFDPKAETDKVMLLITDGEDNEGRGVAAARKAAALGVKIFVFGVGEAAGGPVPGGAGGFKKDERGATVLSRIDEQSLRAIAADTGGTYVRSVAGDLDLDVLYFNGIKASTTAKTLKSGKIRIEEERFFLFLLPALLLLLLEGFLAERRSFRPTALLLPLLLLGALLGPAPARAGDDPDRLYRQGRFAEAEKAYAELDMDHPKDIRYRYNRGCAAYGSGDYQGAIAAFSSAIARAGDDPVRFKAMYNLGNALFQKGDFAAAADLYRTALRTNPESVDARHNLELALRKLEQQKQEQQKKKEQDQEKQQGQQGAPDKKPGGDKGDKGDQKDDAKGGGAGASGEKQPGEGEQPQSGAGKPRDLSGELKPLNEPSESAPQEAAAGPGAAADRKMAETLLNNVSEDRSHLRQQGAGRRRGVRSGKDW
jgi:Ca-activated chloride channel family protein